MDGNGLGPGCEACGIGAGVLHQYTLAELHAEPDSHHGGGPLRQHVLEDRVVLRV